MTTKSEKSVEIYNRVWGAMRDERAGTEALGCPIEVYRVADMRFLKLLELGFFLDPCDRCVTRVAD